MEKQETVRLYHNGKEVGLRLEDLLKKAGVHFEIDYTKDIPELHEGENIHVGARAIRQYANRFSHGISRDTMENRDLQVHVFLDDGPDSVQLRRMLEERDIPFIIMPANGEQLPCVYYHDLAYKGWSGGFSLGSFFLEYGREIV